jgi:hypothetical protein
LASESPQLRAHFTPSSLVLFTLRGSFCYVNDAVLGIMHLQEHFDRVLYAPPPSVLSITRRCVLTARALSATSTLTSITATVWSRLSHTTAACFRCHFTGTARDSSLEQAICHKLTRAMTMQMKMVSASGDLHPQLSCKVLRFDDALEIQSTGEMCWLHPQLLAGICTCPDTPAACHSLNVPYRRGLSDASFMHLFLSIFPAVVEAFWFVFLRRISFREFPDLSSVPRPSCCN